MQDFSGKLIIFSAPSGAGKTTLVRHLLNTELPLSFSVSATSRQARAGEVNGKDYYFLSEEQFRKHIASNDFLEYEEVYPGKFYGTLLSELHRVWDKRRHVIFDVDVIGGLNIKQKYPERALSVFVMPPSEEILEKRLRLRNTETEAGLEERLAKARYEMSFANRFDQIIINDNIENSVAKALGLVSSFIAGNLL
jgi:guanylate kinase